MVPKLWLDLLGKGGLSSEGLGEPGLGDAENWEGREEVDREGRKEAAGRGLGPDTYHGHTASLPTPAVSSMLPKSHGVQIFPLSGLLPAGWMAGVQDRRLRETPWMRPPGLQTPSGRSITPAPKPSAQIKATIL